MKNIISNTLLVLIVFIMISLSVSCSPQKRLNRLVKKHPYLIRNFDQTIIVKDSIYDRDTFYYPGFSDSFQIAKDTVLRKAQYRFSKIKDRYNLQVYPDTISRIDTIFTEKAILVPGKTIDLTPDWIKWAFDHWVLMAYLTLSLALITLVFKQRKAVE